MCGGAPNISSSGPCMPSSSPVPSAMVGIAEGPIIGTCAFGSASPEAGGGGGGGGSAGAKTAVALGTAPTEPDADEGPAGAEIVRIARSSRLGAGPSTAGGLGGGGPGGGPVMLSSKSSMSSESPPNGLQGDAVQGIGEGKPRSPRSMSPIMSSGRSPSSSWWYLKYNRKLLSCQGE